MDGRHALAQREGIACGRAYADTCAARVYGGQVPTEAEEDALVRELGEMNARARAELAAGGIPPAEITTWSAGVLVGFVGRLREIMAQLRAANDAR
ncbi:hypothetical protein DK419_13185 [Methylobacterium terrae]|uniref:Uncharacterized protein n=1 Tax=Methylobacterium terrae TaxID=2202827 RepID=A0A2U8WNV7_9HYPH|nr:hypothetical protein [Methylobacterium terrae]AWN47150.1 hypothetical protein DK419_13185 [Methylobacterium terrae]